MTDKLDVILRRFDDPDEVRTFEKGRFELVRIHGMTIGRATYMPGWREQRRRRLQLALRANPPRISE